MSVVSEGVIVRMPRKPRLKGGKPNPIRVEAARGYGEGGLVDVLYCAEGGFPPGLANGVPVVVCGEPEEKKGRKLLRVADSKGIEKCPSAAALEFLVRKGLPTHVDWDAVARKTDFDGFRPSGVGGLVWLVLQSPNLVAERLKTVVSEADAGAFVKAVLKVFDSHDKIAVERMLDGAGLVSSPVDALEVYDFLVYRAAARKMPVWQYLRQNPWSLAEVEGFDFKEAEALATHVGAPSQSPLRVEGAVRAVLWRHARAGHSYWVRKWLKSEAARMLGEDESVVEAHLRSFRDPPPGVVVGWTPDSKMLHAACAVRTARAVGAARPEDVPPGLLRENEGRAVYLQSVYFCEHAAAEALTAFVRSSAQWMKPVNMDRFLRDAAAVAPLDPGQRAAVEAAARHPLTVVTGAAGTGKTEAAAALAYAALRQGLTVGVYAPTGAAAQRLAVRIRDRLAALGAEGLFSSGTMHLRLRVWKELEDYAEADPKTGVRDVPALEDLVLVDETSMMDVFLLYRLAEALSPPRSRIVLFGDVNQLPPPGPGYVLRDLVDARRWGWFPGLAHVELTHVHRASALTNALHGDVLAGRFPASVPGRLEVLEASDVLDEAVRAVRSLLAEGVPAGDVLVLTPFRRGTSGKVAADALNRVLRPVLNPGASPLPHLDLYLGDPVICVENDYPHRSAYRETASRRTVYNGERGVITGWDPGTGNIEVALPDPKSSGRLKPEVYTPGEARRFLRPAYALTVHKAQGGESPVVVFVCSTADARLLCRELFYTALTRAKHDPAKAWSERVVVVLGDDPKVRECLLEPDVPRFTKLPARLARAAGVLDESVWEEEEGILSFDFGEEEPPMAASPEEDE